MNLLVDLQKQYDVSYLLIAHHLATTRYMVQKHHVRRSVLRVKKRLGSADRADPRSQDL